MGDIADMMLSGILDCETGEYIGDYTEDCFGSQDVGFPVSIQDDSPYNPNNHSKSFIPEPMIIFKCPVCNKNFKSNQSYGQHYKAKHT